MKREKLRHYANVISTHAEAHWVTPLFFFLFFIDSVILFLPMDTLLAATISLKPHHRRKWVLASIFGFALGLGLVAILVNTELHPYLFQLFKKWGYFKDVMRIVEHAQNYGYIELAIGVFTFLPSIFGVLIGVIVGLNPWAVWSLALAGKVVKILATVWIIFSGSKVLKKYISLWLKTSV